MKCITPAAPRDIPELCELLTILFSVEAEFEPDRDRHARALAEIIACPDQGRILVMREEEGITGMVSVLFTVSTARGGRVALLEDMIIRPEHRTDGRGSMLLKAAVALSRREGCLRITLLTDRANAGAIGFYQRHGFSLSQMIPMRLMLN